MVIRTDPNTGKRTYGSGKAPANSTSSMPERIVRGYLERQIPKLRACYETALTSQPELAGQVEAEFALDRNGRVSSSTAKGLEPAVDDCVAATIKNVHFPRPSGGGGVLITYWFRFRAD